MGNPRGVKLTKTFVADLRPPESGQEYWVWDNQLAGFGVRVSPTGRRVYAIRYRTRTGLARKYSLGTADVLTADEARDRAREALAKVAAGGDPMGDRATARAGASVADLEQAYTEHQRGRVKASTAKINAGLWRVHILPAIGRRKAAEISLADMMALHTKIGRTHRIAANSAIILARGAFEWAEAVGMIPKGTNPAKGVALFATRQRQLILTPEQLTDLAAALGQYQKGQSWSAVWAIRLLMLTGLRKTEWTKSRWEWIDWQARTLSLPDSKSGARVVTLPEIVMDVLRELRNLTNSEWIIPAPDPDKPLATIDRHWLAIKKLACIPLEVRIHDLRHTFGSYAHRGGISQKGVADLLGHKQMRTTERYIHSLDADKRDNAGRAASAMMGNNAQVWRKKGE